MKVTAKLQTVLVFVTSAFQEKIVRLKISAATLNAAAATAIQPTALASATSATLVKGVKS